MAKKQRWILFLLYSSAVLLGILTGPFIAGWITGTGATGRSLPAAEAADVAPLVALLPDSPDSPDAVFVCAPRYVGNFGNRIHVLCTTAATGGIIYFATPTSDSKNAARVLSIMLTAKALGKNLQIYYSTSGDGSAYGCGTSDCRPINYIEMMN